MKDEEMARDYTLTRRKDLHLSQRDINLMQLAYLQGLKAAKPQWHDLRKDPTDVPENKRNVWCITSDGGKEGFYDKERETPWVIGSSYWSMITAWCELPKWED